MDGLSLILVHPEVTSSHVWTYREHVTKRGSSNADDQLRKAHAAMRQAYDDAAQIIDSIPDPQQAFDHATQLREEIDDLVGRAAELRALMVKRIWENEQLSLAGLANRIGVSKSRADQLIQTALKATKDA